MKFLLLLTVFCIGITLSVALSRRSSESAESSSEEEYDHRPHHRHQPKKHNHHGKCEGLEDIDLSDLNLDVTDLRKHLSNWHNDDMTAGEKFSFLDMGEVSFGNIRTAVSENGMGVIRKVVILPTKKRIYAKIMKSIKGTGDFTTSMSGSMNSSVDASTAGKATFGVDLQIFTPKVAPHNTIKGEANVVANSSTAWVKKGRMNVVETKSTSHTVTKLTWSDEDSSLSAAGSMTSDSSASSTSDTIILSKKCFASKIVVSFNSSAAGTGWTSSVVGKGKGGVFTHILFSTANGTSVAWTFAKLSIKTHLDIKGGNMSVTGSQVITVRSFTETITRPANASAENAAQNLEVSNEIKIRVGAMTKLSTGTKIFSTGGQLLFRSSRVSIPADATIENHQGSTDEFEGDNGDDEEVATMMVSTVIRKQVQADDLLMNPAFVNSVIAEAIN